jgi:hypothetical protein
MIEFFERFILTANNMYGQRAFYKRSSIKKKTKTF